MGPVDEDLIEGHKRVKIGISEENQKINIDFAKNSNNQNSPLDNEKGNNKESSAKV